jgi:putative hydrolase of the HAD superfamily
VATNPCLLISDILVALITEEADGNEYKAVIFDMGGVLLRSEDNTSRETLAKEYGLTLLELEAAVFDSESAKIATVGKIADEVHWQNTFTSLHVPADKQTQFEQMFWAGDRCDQNLVQFLRDLRPQYKTVCSVTPGPTRGRC